MKTIIITLFIILATSSVSFATKPAVLVIDDENGNQVEVTSTNPLYVQGV